MSLTLEQVEAAVAEHGSIRKAAKALGRDDRTLRRILKRAGRTTPPRPSAKPEPRSFTRKGHEAELTGPATRGDADEVETLIRENGLDPADWVVTSVTLNRWDGPVAGGGTQPLRQVKVSLRLRPELIFPTPAAHHDVPPVRARRPGPPKRDRPELIVVEGDHQAPYHDPDLHEKGLQLLADLKPVEHVLLGDTGDYPTISRHADHPAAMATAQECVDASYRVIRDKREAAPQARTRKLKGNHDWRVEGELLTRAERMYGLRPAEEELPALSLQRLLHLDALGVELVEDPRGWEHAEVELIPGPAGLVVRHGWLTGANTAERSLRKRGRSLIVGHGHSRELTYAWDPSAEVERVAAQAGTMSLARSRRFPHFAVCDDWLQGLVTVTRWPDGRFVVEHAVYQGGTLYWRDRRW